MHPSDEAWIWYQQSLGYTREEAQAALLKYSHLVQYATDGTAPKQSNQEPEHGKP